jgi:hypothetical protein
MPVEIGKVKTKAKANLEEASRVGELLVKTKQITPEQLSDALILAEKTSTPVGRILLMTAKISERNLQSVLSAQTMIRSGKISYPSALEMLHVARQGQVSFQEALKTRPWTAPESATESANQLATLLLDAGILTQKEIQAAQARSKEMAMPLGRTLVLMGFLSPSVMATALDAWVYLKRKQLTLEDAVLSIKIAHTRRISIEQALIQEGRHKPKTDHLLRLGELFSMAGMLSETDKLWAVETSLEDGLLYGETLTDHNLASAEEVDAALELQQMVDATQITGEQAAEILKCVKEKRLPVKEAGQYLLQTGSDVVALLGIAGLVSAEQIEAATSKHLRSTIDLSQHMRQIGIISPNVCTLGHDCLELVRSNKLTMTQAGTLLNYCSNNAVTLSQGLQELAWDQVAREKSTVEHLEFAARSFE